MSKTRMLLLKTGIVSLLALLIFGNRLPPPGFKQGKSLTGPHRNFTPQAEAEQERLHLCVAA